MRLEDRAIVWAGFHSHILIPHTVVGSIGPITGAADVPSWRGLEMDRRGNVTNYYYEGKAVLRVSRPHVAGSVSLILLTAMQEVWIQEPAQIVRLPQGGIWRGYNRERERYTTEPMLLHDRDAHRSTVHFSRVRGSSDYTDAVELMHPDLGNWRMWASHGFDRALDWPLGAVPWQDCQIFGTGLELIGTVSSVEPLRRWELAGHHDIDQMYFLGWTGGAGAVTDEKGRDVGSPGNRYLWQPRSWRKMPAESKLTQRVIHRAL